jgi:DNA-binding transcriptional ArsR family regulator
MGITKSDFFTGEQNELANMFKALAHPARIAIVEFLLKYQKCVCGDIVDALPLAQPTISQHLRALKEANIIQGTIDGNNMCYCLNANSIGKMTRILKGIEEQVTNLDNKFC